MGVMDDFVWVQTNPLSTHAPMDEDLSVNKLRLLIMRATSTDDCETLQSLLCSLPTSDTPLIHSAMCRAASRGHLRAFSILARHCENIHADDSRRATNTIISSVVGGYVEILDFILSNGGDIDRPTKSGRTALTTAISLGRFDLLTLVLSRGANVSKLSSDGRSCLCIAATMGSVDLVEILLQHGASANCGCHCFAPGLYDKFHCALDVAAMRGYIDVVVLLLNYGACLFRESDLFLTVLEALLRRGDEHLARQLIATGPSPDTPLQGRNITPLCLAIQRGSLEVVRFLVACGANIHVPSADGTPICYAVLNNNTAIFEWLIRCGADVNGYSETYGRAIHIAVEFGFVGMVDMILRNGAEVYDNSPKGYPLPIARREWRQSCTSERQRRFESIIDLLKNAGASDDESRATSTGVYEPGTAVDVVERESTMGRVNAWLDWG